MFHTENKLRTSWDFLVLAVTVFAVIEIPLSMVFDLSSTLVAASVWIILGVFVADILVHFNTGFYRLSGKRSSNAAPLPSGTLRAVSGLTCWPSCP
ncbi:hypothetical protein ES708_10647 [subsurface metagenome]